jgi:acyl-CoA thioester hydrolase
MPRVKVDEQPAYEFSSTIMLQPRDINKGGHLGNDSLVSLIGSARAQMLHSLSLSEGDLGDAKTGVIMADLIVNFKAEGFLFDEMQIDTHIGELGRTGFRVFYRVRRGETVVALAETGMVAFDYTTRRVGHVPKQLIEALNRHRANIES